MRWSTAYLKDPLKKAYLARTASNMLSVAPTKHCMVAAAVWALLLERTHPTLATDVIYVAGDRVVTDPLCKPFSMGRNLFCVHSKKRMDDFPELKAEKQRTNRRTLAAMSKGLREVCSCPALLYICQALQTTGIPPAVWLSKMQLVHNLLGAF